MTVLELAKELGIPVPKLKPTLDSLGVQVRSVSAILQEQDVQRVRQALGKAERPVVKRVARPEEAPAAPAPSEEPAPERAPEVPAATPQPVAGVAPTDRPRAAASPAPPSARPRPSQPPTARRPEAPTRPRGPEYPRLGAAPVSAPPGRGGDRRDRGRTERDRTRPYGGRVIRSDEVARPGVRMGTGTRWTRTRKPATKKPLAPPRPKEPEKLEVTLTGPVTVKNLAAQLQTDPSRVLGQLLAMGILADINRTVDAELAGKIGETLGRIVHLELQPQGEEAAAASRPAYVPRGKPVLRPPVVTIMGHVDHGKTTLLDAVRHTKVTEQEVGGITQHIGAYQVDVGGKKVTFLDTPGHEAFTAMRARGARVTDIAVLVVAADDGVMPQTIEAIHHAQAAKVPIIVAINKIDRPEAQPDRIMQQLAEHNLVPEDWGGDTVTVQISAKNKVGLDQLLEMILLVAEVQDLKADPNVPAVGTIIEAELDKQRGPVATVLIQEGALRVGDSVIAGTAHGKVRAMTDHTGRAVKTAGPSRPAVITGLDTVPQAGDVLEEVSGERLAKAVTSSRQVLERADRVKAITRVTLQDLYQQIQTGEVRDLNIVLKVDVQGSIEAIAKSLQELGTAEVRTNILHAGVGDVSESDVMLAAASSAIIIGFHVRCEAQARALAGEQGIDVRLYQVIYDIIDDVKAAMVGLLAPVFEEEVLGQAEVKALFKVSRLGTVAGCGVTRGRMVRGADVRVLRGGEKVFQGKIESLKHLKDDVREVQEGYECGILTPGFNDYQIGDVLEAYRTKEVRRETL